MSTSCITAAPTRHPSGEAQAAPVALPLPATTIAAALAMNRAGEPLTHRPQPSLAGGVACPVARHVAAQSLRSTNVDAPTPTHPTTSALCRPKRIRRHQTTHDTIRAPSHARHASLKGGANQLLDFWTPGAQVRKSKSRSRFSNPFRQKQSRNKASNAPRPAGRGKTFGPPLWGPPGAHAGPKVQKRKVSRDAPAERSASGVDALQRSLTIRSLHHRCRRAPSRALQTLGSVLQFCDFCVYCPFWQTRKIAAQFRRRCSSKTSRNAEPNAQAPAPPGKNFAAR